MNASNGISNIKHIEKRCTYENFLICDFHLIRNVIAKQCKKLIQTFGVSSLKINSCISLKGHFFQSYSKLFPQNLWSNQPQTWQKSQHKMLIIAASYQRIWAFKTLAISCIAFMDTLHNYLNIHARKNKRLRLIKEIHICCST